MEVPSNNEQTSLVSNLPILSLTLGTLIALLLGYFKSKFFSLQTKNLPPGSLGFPFWGETLSFLKALKQDHVVQWVADRITRHGPVFKTSLIGSKVVVITGQAGNRFVFSGSDNGVASNLPLSQASILGKRSIFEISGSRHKLVRGAMMTFLKPESLQRFVGEMDTIVKQQLLQELNGKDSIHGVTLMKTITFNVTCSLLFGLQDGKEKLDALYEDFAIALKGNWAIPLECPGTVFRKAMQARRKIYKFFSNVVREKKREIELGKIVPGSQADMILTFLALRDENGKPLSEEEMIDNFITLVFASHDTTTIVLSMFMRHLARDPEVRSMVLVEQKKALKAREEKDGKVGWSEIQMMKYTWRVAQELMRLTPPVFGNFKTTSRDTSFAGFHIPKGWKVFWVTSPTHMDENIFQEPEKFDPSRFENPTKSIPPYTYVPFGAGPRICPGGEFARLEVLLIIHYLIINYEWMETIPNEPLTREPLPYPAFGLPLNIHPKKNA
ncbi:hypothetical protein Acr_24g0012970 [Actinidia rufa]|uniref:Cytochrome P450, family 716, subfamily A, polypeptide 1 n=1 Tax=Actinidia rufa TaxID=165716 RepID=A0A7J0GW79_9ERIC|nr:hypothetical protein Acr_24g0012970 [Actinidia rufa]